MGCAQNSLGVQGSIELGLISLPASSIGRLTMRSAHSIPLAVTALWVGCISAAVYCSEMSAAAGRLPQRWAGWGMLAGFVVVTLVVVGVWHLPAGVPRLVSRVIQLVGMAGAFWSVGTLTRALYTVVG
jgi:hypothetical protein